MIQTKIKILLISIILTQTSCTKKLISTINYNAIKTSDSKPDYSNINFWAAHPWKWDPSDSISKSLLNTYLKDSTVDAFFVHPTTLLNIKDERWNATIDDSAINLKTDNTTILYQASVLSEKCRVFAPRYRQAHIKSFFTDNKLQAAIAFELAYSDVKKAFEYYLLHYNNDRPIIIAAHSQGTIHAARLIKEFFEGKTLQKKLVCAYLIGMPTPVDYFKQIPGCTDSLSTGCFVGWRTFERDYIDTNYISKEKFKNIVTNPLTWTTTEEYASSKLNIGGILKNYNKLKSNVVDAQIHNNILCTCKPKIFGSFFIKQKNYHIGDINLFYNNIKQNIATRIKMYWLKEL